MFFDIGWFLLLFFLQDILKLWMPHSVRKCALYNFLDRVLFLKHHRERCQYANGFNYQKRHECKSLCIKNSYLVMQYILKILLCLFHSLKLNSTNSSWFFHLIRIKLLVSVLMVWFDMFKKCRRYLIDLSSTLKWTTVQGNEIVQRHIFFLWICKIWYNYSLLMNFSMRNNFSELEQVKYNDNWSSFVNKRMKEIAILSHIIG